MRNETRLAGAEITRERALHVLDRTGLHEEAREMRAADLAIAGKFAGPLGRACDAASPACSASSSGSMPSPTT